MAGSPISTLAADPFLQGLRAASETFSVPWSEATNNKVYDTYLAAYWHRCTAPAMRFGLHARDITLQSCNMACDTRPRALSGAPIAWDE